MFLNLPDGFLIKLQDSVPMRTDAVFKAEGWSQQIMIWFSFDLHPAIYRIFLEM